MDKEQNNDIGFEDNIASAKNILEKLIDPEITLAQSVDIYKDGMKELDDAQKLLDEAKLQYEEYIK